MLIALLAGVLVVLFIVLPLIGIAAWALISVAIVGIIIGGIARLALPGRQSIGMVGTVLLGWIGSIIGGFFGNHIIHTGRIITIILEIVIAAVLIAIFAGRNRGRQTSGSGI
ncbi:MAG: GlsB/YeaQ/YmgE family stress response membrane protein [Mycobacterium sp.]